MNKKFLALIITLATLQPGTSSCMWLFGKGNISDPEELLSKYVSPYINPVDQENIKLEEEFNKLWDRVKNADKEEKPNKLNEKEIKQLAEIFKKITPEKNPEIIKRLKEKSSKLVKSVLYESVKYEIPDIAEKFFTNKQLSTSIINTGDIQQLLEYAIERKSLKLIPLLIKRGAQVKQEHLCVLLYQYHTPACHGINKDGLSNFFCKVSFYIKCLPKNTRISKKQLLEGELLDSVKLLIENGASLNPDTDTYDSPLSLAIKLYSPTSSSQKHFKIFELITFLLEKGADPKKAEWDEIIPIEIRTEKKKQRLWKNRANIFLLSVLSEKNVNPAKIEDFIRNNRILCQKIREKKLDIIYYKDNLTGLSNILTNNTIKIITVLGAAKRLRGENGQLLDSEIVTPGAAQLEFEKNKDNVPEFQETADTLLNLLQMEKNMQLKENNDLKFNDLLNQSLSIDENNDIEKDNEQKQPKKILPPNAMIGKIIIDEKKSNIVRPDVNIICKYNKYK